VAERISATNDLASLMVLDDIAPELDDELDEELDDELDDELDELDEELELPEPSIGSSGV
jgi:hypothetical protein